MLVSSATLVLFGGILTSASGLIERILVARVLSVSAYGEVSTGLAVLGFGSTLGLFGMSQGITRYVSYFEDDHDVRGVWVTGLAVTSVLSILTVLGLVADVEQVNGLFFDRSGSKPLLIAFALCILPYVGLEVGIGGIRGFENTIYRTYVYDLLYPRLRILLVGGGGRYWPGSARSG